MNFIVIVIGAFLGCLLENLMLGVIHYFLKRRLLKNQVKGGAYGAKKNYKNN